MSQLVRARPIAVEFLPDWAKCCDAFIAAQQSEELMTLDLATATMEALLCKFCEADHGELVTAVDVADGLRTELALLDLDEGPIAEQP